MKIEFNEVFDSFKKMNENDKKQAIIEFCKCFFDRLGLFLFIFLCYNLFCIFVFTF